MGCEPPVYGGSGGVALGLISADVPLQGFFVGVTSLEAGSGQHAELDLRHVQPATVLGGVVELQALGDPPGFGGREGLIEGRSAMSVQVVGEC